MASVVQKIANCRDLHPSQAADQKADDQSNAISSHPEARRQSASIALCKREEVSRHLAIVLPTRAALARGSGCPG